MNLNTVLNRLPTWYQSGECYLLTSPPGRGKSTTIEAAPRVIEKALGYPAWSLGLVVVNGGNLTTMDTLGFGLPRHYEATETTPAHSEMVFSDPFFWRTEEGKRLNEYKGGILFVDEADKMAVEVKKVVGEGALSGRFGPHRLPKGWVVWMAANRAKDRSGSTKELDHLINRQCQIQVDDDVRSLIDWMDANDVSPLVKAFTEQNPQVVLGDTPEKQGPWCTPRSLVKADRYMQLLAKASGEIPEDPTTVEEIAGRIGSGAAAQLFAFVKLEKEMPRYEDIVKNPDKVKVPSKPDGMMLVAYSLAYKVTAADAEPVITYMKRFPKEFATTFTQSASKRSFELLQQPAFRQWVKENASLLVALAPQ